MNLKRLYSFILFIIICSHLIAQQKNTSTTIINADSALKKVTVTAFSLQSKWQDAPAAVAVINKQQLQLLDNTSLVPILNTVAGVRMEERSPGSYRLSIRGSLLRAPFGVRNIKVYWNDIPLTDAGGNTYLQLVDISQVQSAEVIKGPASSLYGANTGGAVILHSGEYATNKTNAFNAAVTGGSFGLFNEQAGWTFTNKKFQSNVQQVHQQTDGYRQQSAMRRDAVKWDGNWQISNKEKLSFLSFYSDLYYQTPGGLTASQVGTDTTAYPKAILQHNAIYNKTIFAGVSLSSDFSKHFNNITTVTSNHTSFKNPFTTNYEMRNEWNYGGRTTFAYHVETKRIQLKWLAGAEWLQNKSDINNFGNNAGKKDTVQYMDRLAAAQRSLFTQINLQIGTRLALQAGLSNNQQNTKYKRLTDPLQDNFVKNKSNSLLAPRFSVLYKLVNDISVYGVLAKGFSPPSLAELHPTNGGLNDSLQPEYGWNFEAGFKGSALQNRLLFDVSAYHFGLRDAIVKRSNATIEEYYVNAGRTKQQGIEAFVKGWLLQSDKTFFSSLAASNSFSYQPYSFTSYIVGSADYSGNRITGVPRTINVSTIEVTTKPGFYANFVLNNTSKIALTDANDVYAKPYHLLQCKLGFQHQLKDFKYNIFAGADNLLNETYSLGNDINAFGKRYYNPAPKRNFYAGLQVGF